MAFPTTLDSLADKTDAVDYPQANDINVLNAAVESLEAKVGVDSSAVATSIDYLIKNTSSGHDHDGSGSKKVAAANLTNFLDEDNMASNSAVSVSSQQSIKAYVDAAITTAKAALFPVGSIYTAIVSTNPGTLLGFGTWTAFGAGKVLVGLDSGDTDFDLAEETGGAKTVSIAHTHAVTGSTEFNAVTETVDGSGSTTVQDNNHAHNVSITSQGMSANATPSIVQPYVVVYFWKRTA